MGIFWAISNRGEGEDTTPLDKVCYSFVNSQKENQESLPFQQLLVYFCLCQQVLPKKANISGSFLLCLRLQKVSLQKIQWRRYQLIRSSLVQIHDICKIFELLTKLISFKMCQIDEMPTKSLCRFKLPL